MLCFLFPLLLPLLFSIRGDATPAEDGEAIDEGDDTLAACEAFSLFCFMRICALAIRPELMVIAVCCLRLQRSVGVVPIAFYRSSFMVKNQKVEAT